MNEFGSHPAGLPVHGTAWQAVTPSPLGPFAGKPPSAKAIEPAMSHHPTDFQGSVIDAVRQSIEAAVPDSRAEVTGGGGHYSIVVVSPAFQGKSMLESQRLVYSAIAHLMKGDMAPVHAVDSLKTRVPG